MPKKIVLLLIILLIALTFGCTEQTDANQPVPIEQPPLEDANFSFLVYGDTRGEGDASDLPKYEQHKKIVSLMEKENYEFIINTGDLVLDGCKKEQWNNFLEIVNPICKNKEGTLDCNASTNYLDSKYFPVPGNHDKTDSCPKNYFGIFPFLNKEHNYSFEKENAYFIFLDSTVKINDENTLNWLESELIKASEKDFIFVSFHYPPFSSGGHGSDEKVKQNWVPLFEDYNVDLVFNGHSHYYARSKVNDVTYIIAGGGGAKLYEPELKDHSIFIKKINHYVKVNITGSVATISVIDSLGEIVEEFNISS